MTVRPLFFADSSYVTYCGRNPDGITKSGQIPREAVTAFIRGCVNDGWKSVAVVTHNRVLGKYVNGNLTINGERAA